MKNLIFTLLAIFMVTAISAQSLTLADADGVVITNGETIVLTGEASGEIVAHAQVTNTTSSDVSVLVKKIYLDVPSTANAMFCWGLCYGPATFVSPDPLTIAANTTDENNFSGHYMGQGYNTPAEVMWVFFNEADVNDSVAFITRFEPTGGISTSYAVTMNCDMSSATDFDPASDVVYMTGSMFGWAEPGTQAEDQTLTDEDGDMIYSVVLNVEGEQTYEYKYFLNAGWDGGEWAGGDNRIITVSEETTINDMWGTTAVSEISLDDVNVYPNPFSSSLTVDGMENIQTVTVYNITGQMVYQSSVSGSSVSINTSAFTSGVYFAVLTDSNSNQATIKVVRD